MEQMEATLPAKKSDLKVSVPKTKVFLNKAWDVYGQLLKTWNIDLIFTLKQYKIVALNKESRVVCLITYTPTNSRNIDIDLIHAFSEAKKRNACKLFICTNHPNEEIIPDDEEIKMAKELRAYGRKENMPVVDQIIMSNGNLFSFAKNRL